jgi:hypothetical protein
MGREFTGEFLTCFKILALIHKLPAVQILDLPAAELTPSFHFNKEKGIFKIGDRSLTDQPEIAFKPALEWLREYAKNPNSSTVMTIKFDYFNTATSRELLDLFKILETIPGSKIVWQFVEDDEDVEEAGQELAELVTVPFEFQPL